jgi:PAS domain S-box-containing protein
MDDLTRVLIVDDHEIVRRGVRALLSTRADFEVCGEAVDGRDGLAKAKQLRPDVIVMDISMPNLNGLEATRLIRTALPDTEVLILSQHEGSEMIRQALTAGARGYVLKSSVSEDLDKAVEFAGRHQPFVSGQDNPSVHDSQEILQRGAALELALRDSEERFRSAFEQAAVGFGHIAPDGRWLRVNQKLCDILGYTQEELLRRKYQDGTHTADVAADVTQSEKVAAGQLDRYSIEKRYIRKSGLVVWINLTMAAVRDCNHKLKYFIAVIEDISDRKRAEEAQSRLAAIVESSDDIIISKDLHGIITSWNATAERIFGYSAQEAVGQHITALIIPAELHEEEAQILRLLRAGQRIEHYQTRRVTKTGKQIHISATISPVKDAVGRVIGASKIARNITDREHSEKKLQENQELLRAAFTQTYSFLAVLSNDGTILEANRAAIEGTGFSRDEVIGQKLWEVWWGSLPEEQAIAKTSVATAASGLAVREECEYALRDGTIRFADRTLNPVQNDRGEVVMIVASGLDMTEHRQLRSMLEERVHERTRELETKNRELIKQADVVRELSARLLQIQDEERRRIARELHDSVGQMLAAVNMNLAQVEAEIDKLSPEASKAMASNTGLLQEISNEIRTISHLLHPPLLDDVGLQSALEWYIEGFSERSKIQVDLELPDDFGRLPRRLEITLFRVVQECLTNIHRHSGSTTAAVRVARSPNEVRLEVQDAGKGFPAETQASLASGKLSGVGLRGMSERLRQMGGQLEVHSNGKGTVVSATLPVETIPAKEAIPSAKIAAN